VDVAAVLARTLAPEPMRPAWPEPLYHAHSVIPRELVPGIYVPARLRPASFATTRSGASDQAKYGACRRNNDADLDDPAAVHDDDEVSPPGRW
jgi:hypothetical protein